MPIANRKCEVYKPTAIAAQHATLLRNVLGKYCIIENSSA